MPEEAIPNASTSSESLSQFAEAARQDHVRFWKLHGGRRLSRRWRRATLALLAIAMICSLVWFLHDRPRYRNGIRYDPIEDDEDIQPALRAAEREAETQMRGYQSHMGYGKGLWLTKQAILREKYGIEWRTPAELNPKIAFD